MSEQEQLPVCRLCGEPPGYYGKLVGCSKPCCGIRSALMTSYDWRRLMTRPRLAPEHVTALSACVNACGLWGWTVARAGRAALAALGEE